LGSAVSLNAIQHICGSQNASCGNIFQSFVCSADDVMWLIYQAKTIPIFQGMGGLNPLSPHKYDPAECEWRSGKSWETACCTKAVFSPHCLL